MKGTYYVAIRRYSLAPGRVDETIALRRFRAYDDAIIAKWAAFHGSGLPPRWPSCAFGGLTRPCAH
jgi:hypothetical protein